LNEPKLRFKADDGSQFPDWNEKTFNDVADYKKGPFGSALKKEIFVPKSNDTVKVYEQQNAISKDWKLERYFVTNEYFQSKMKSFAVSGGDIIVSCAGTIGEMYELPHDAEEGIINQALMRVRIKKSVINSMIFRCVFDKMISTEGVKISNGSALKNIPPFADMKKQSVFVPSLPEQQKIAEFLSTIDTVIEKQKETVSAWEERKKGVMQKLFSQEARFKADDGSNFPEWKEKKIDDLFYKVNERNNGQFGKDKWISVAKMYYQDEDKVTSNNIDTRTYVMRVGDMSFEGHPNKEFKYGRFVVNDIGDGIISELFPIYRHKENYILKYWKYAIQVDSIMQKVYRKSITSSGASSNKLDDDDFKRQSILVPCLAEQQKIADCLSSLDEVIEKQKATLTAWEELKKGLLQQMFV
jgi:type I restriction enzyme S subunit